MLTNYKIRQAGHEDAQAIARLMQGLGFDHSVEEILRRWHLVGDGKSNPVLIAHERENAVGLMALHIAPLLFYPEPVARITTLVVAARFRRRGLGRALVTAAECLAKEAGCATVELTTGNHRIDAHAFYRNLGFEALALRMERRVS
ncbi:GNAT family N-acetyltransferase [Paracoccus onubensis]|uniref:GNAT family N-acetyltransferase n=1 Tax=Paracoccus onubensis TaxID=1675788 RepID=UPI0027303663|nr:GNAT family N-acetyltransferase [Paracoccus onubensis]MDP0929866.1 GNAT family N-acetyltransferase [Paracoccus onubensis]